MILFPCKAHICNAMEAKRGTCFYSYGHAKKLSEKERLQSRLVNVDYLETAAHLLSLDSYHQKIAVFLWERRARRLTDKQSKVLVTELPFFECGIFQCHYLASNALYLSTTICYITLLARIFIYRRTTTHFSFDGHILRARHRRLFKQ